MFVILTLLLRAVNVLRSWKELVVYFYKESHHRFSSAVNMFSHRKELLRDFKQNLNIYFFFILLSNSILLSKLSHEILFFSSRI